MVSIDALNDYTALHHQVDGTNATTDLGTIKCGTMEQRAVWEERRACWRYGRYPSPGKAESTKEALKAAHGHTLVCKVQACRALVDLQSARRIARAAGRSDFEDGDGCGSRCCSAKHWRGRFHSQQIKMATALRDGSRVLVLWPESTEGRVELRVVPGALAASIADSIANRG